MLRVIDKGRIDPPQMMEAAHCRGGMMARSSKFKRLGVQKARSSEGSAGRKSVNEFKNGKSACFVFGGCRKPLSAPPSRRRKGRDGDPRLAPDGPGPKKFRPRLRGVMISRRGRGKSVITLLFLLISIKRRLQKV